MQPLTQLTIQNFQYIRDQTVALGRLNFLIGANGAGESNLIQVLRLLREIALKNLGQYSLIRGADALLHFGRKRSPALRLTVEFGETTHKLFYPVKLKPTDEDRLIIAEEMVGDNQQKKAGDLINNGANESELDANKWDFAALVARPLQCFQVYHFHDASESAKLKGTCDLEDNRRFHPQGDNLAAFLYWMQQKHPGHLARLQDTVRLIAPFFQAFRLAPSRLNENKIRLEWQERGGDGYFNAAALSDGTLRFICLATLLLQPELPPFILLDEPELGLHPAAIQILAGLLKVAAVKSQIIVATQSVTLVDQMEAHDIIVADRLGEESVFSRCDTTTLAGWLEDYSLGELWGKNVLGGRP